MVVGVRTSRPGAGELRELASPVSGCRAGATCARNQNCVPGDPRSATAAAGVEEAAASSKVAPATVAAAGASACATRGSHDETSCARVWYVPRKQPGGVRRAVSVAGLGIRRSALPTAADAGTRWRGTSARKITEVAFAVSIRKSCRCAYRGAAGAAAALAAVASSCGNDDHLRCRACRRCHKRYDGRPCALACATARALRRRQRAARGARWRCAGVGGRPARAADDECENRRRLRCKVKVSSYVCATAAAAIRGVAAVAWVTRPAAAAPRLDVITHARVAVGENCLRLGRDGRRLARVLCEPRAARGVCHRADRA